MDEIATQTGSDLVLFAIVVQIVLAVAAFWYAWETRRMRLQNAEQMDLLRRQARLTVAPFLLVGMLPTDPRMLREHVEQEGSMDEEKRGAALKLIEALGEGIAKEKLRFIAAVHNPTQKVALQANAYVYDHQHKSYLEGYVGKEVLAAASKETIPIGEPYYDRKGIIQAIQRDYGPDSSFALRWLEPGDTSFLAFFFRDLEGRLYLIRREFGIDSAGQFIHKPSRMFFDVQVR